MLENHWSMIIVDSKSLKLMSTFKIADFASHHGDEIGSTLNQAINPN